MGLEDPSIIEKRAADHWEITLKLLETNDEWAAVTAFYSCYHLTRVALLTDPIFDDLGALKAIHENLTPDERTESRHQVRVVGRPRFGMVDLVQALYKYMGSTYRTLHQASVDVRYYRGLRQPVTLTDVCSLAEKFRQEFAAGNLRYSAAKHLV